MRLMAIMAHPDDAEIWCGGTLILHTAKGDDVHICTLSFTDDSQRGLEALQSARQMGCSIEFIGLKDVNIRDTEQAVVRLWKSIETFQPETIITHWFDDMHPDHEATFRILRRAILHIFLAASKEDSRTPPRIFCCDSLGSVGLHGPFKPDRYVDVTDIWDRKISAINVHQSQPLSLFLERIDRQCLAHGKEAGVKRAEGFLYLPIFGLPDNGQPLGD